MLRGVKTLAGSATGYPVAMTRASVAPEVLREMGITPDLVRI